MDNNAVTISPITGTLSSPQKPAQYSVLMIQQNIEEFKINDTLYQDVPKSIFFLEPQTRWRLRTSSNGKKSGYLLSIKRETLSNPLLKNLHINQVRLFNANKIARINLAPGIEKRIYSILEMIDELIDSDLNHKEDAIVSLLHTFFVYCDGQCNIRSHIPEKSGKKTLVYKFKTLIDRQLHRHHRVNDYARLLKVSDKYLNECVNKILNRNAKSIIDEQLMMKARNELKFTDKSIKEISFELGFSSPSYFSSFFKRHSGLSPSSLRKSTVPKI